MGDKDEARRTAKAAGVPIVEGSDLLNDADEAEREAKRIGFPLLIKARAGGGGRGIRKVESLEKVRSSFQEASSELGRRRPSAAGSRRPRRWPPGISNLKNCYNL